VIGPGRDLWGSALLGNQPFTAIRAARQPSLATGHGIEALCRYQLGRRIRLAHQATHPNTAATLKPTQGPAPYRSIVGLSGKPPPGLQPASHSTSTRPILCGRRASCQITAVAGGVWPLFQRLGHHFPMGGMRAGSRIFA
jgi:hypothetical protein